MGSAREVKNRIKSVKNIAQITRALEAVSASRVRRAQERVLASRNYAEKAWEILLNVNAASKGNPQHPMLAQREEISAVLLVVITSDRGLAGSYNTNVLRVAERFAQRLGKPVKYLAIGRKGRDTLFRQGKDVIAEFSDMPADPTVSDVSAIARLCMEEFLSGNVDEVLIAYTDFINMLTQSPVVLGWLPLTPDTVANQVAAEHVKAVPQISTGTLSYEYEPSPEAVVTEIVPRFTELQLYQALLEAQASEHAARMTAMRNATDNASGLVDDLTLEYNKARQAAITNEILDIVGGASALEATLKAKAASKSALQAQAVINTPNVARPMADVAPVVESVGDAYVSQSEPAVAKQSAAKPKKATPATAAVDDLTKLEGVGKKMSQALINGGFDSFEKIANASETDLRQAIEAAGMKLAPSLGTWAEQAKLAAIGDWNALQQLQDGLKGGRRVDGD
jgi:F-type H+-transporting ATPase subunit gamma